MHDLVIRGGSVVDGSSRTNRVANVRGPCSSKQTL